MIDDQRVDESVKNKRVTRRNFLTLGCGVALSGATACVLGSLYATQAEPSWIEVVKQDVRLSALPAALDGFTIAQLSDFHRGPYVSAEHIRHSVDLANGLEADLIVLTGDYVHRSERYSASCAQALASLRAKHGVFAVLGNHDIWAGAGEVAARLSGAGIVLLRNATHALDVEDARLWLLGVEDAGYSGHSFGSFRARWNRAAYELALMLETLPADEARLLLVHNPDFTEMLPEGRVDLALCGHTHGGQVRIPFFGAPVVPSSFGQKYVGGLVEGPRTLVYVNRGIGLSPPAVRFNCRPEVTMITLRAEESA